MIVDIVIDALCVLATAAQILACVGIFVAQTAVLRVQYAAMAATTAPVLVAAAVTVHWGPCEGSALAWISAIISVLGSGTISSAAARVADQREASSQ